MTVRAGDSVHETIVARATPRGASALSIVRLSGPRAVATVDGVFPAKALGEQASHSAHVGFVERDGVTIDQVVVTLFLAPNSATGEDIVEVSCHGGDVASDALIRLLVSEGARMAEPGEFTLRAFLNGKVDLTQAEAIAELIHAQSQRAGRISLAHLKGRFSEELDAIREALLQLVALLELELDFGEEDVAFADRERLVSLLDAARSRLEAMTGSFRFGRALHDGVRVVIIGKPNAGKSTLMNALLGYDRVIVSAQPGTTRDEVESHLEFEGVRFTFVDTAGRRETYDQIEAEGVRRSKEAEQGADLVLLLKDAGEDTEPEAGFDGVPRLVIANKADLLSSAEIVAAQETADLVVSAERMRSGEDSVEELLEHVFAATVGSSSQAEEHQVVTSQRQQEHIRAAVDAIQRVNGVLESGGSGDMISADVRLVIDEIGRITGEVTNEDILDRIFSQFCIGK